MVPDGWGIVKLEKIAETVTSGSRDWAQYYSESGSKFIRMTNLRRDGIHLKSDTSGKAGGLKTCEPLKAVKKPLAT